MPCAAPLPILPGALLPGAIEHQPRRWSKTTRINVARAVWLLVLGVIAALARLLTGGLL